MIGNLVSKIQALVVGPSLADKRAQARAKCEIPVSCQTKSGAIVCSLKDLSLRGAQLETNSKLARGSEVLLLPPKGSDSSDKAVKSKVVWSKRYRGQYFAGLRFQDGRSGGWVQKLLRELGLSVRAPSQRRRLIRFPSEMKAKALIHSKFIDVEILDLSLGGANIASPEPFTKDISVGLNIPKIPGCEALSFSCNTIQSRRVSPSVHHISVRFNKLSKTDKNLLIKRLNLLLRKS